MGLRYIVEVAAFKNKCYLICRRAGTSQVLVLWAKQALKLIQSLMHERLESDIFNLSAKECRLMLTLLRENDGQVYIATVVTDG